MMHKFTRLAVSATLISILGACMSEESKFGPAPGLSTKEHATRLPGVAMLFGPAGKMARVAHHSTAG